MEEEELSNHRKAAEMAHAIHVSAHHKDEHFQDHRYLVATVVFALLAVSDQLTRIIDALEADAQVDD